MYIISIASLLVIFDYHTDISTLQRLVCLSLSMFIVHVHVHTDCNKLESDKKDRLTNGISESGDDRQM